MRRSGLSSPRPAANHKAECESAESPNCRSHDGRSHDGKRNRNRIRWKSTWLGLPCQATGEAWSGLEGSEYPDLDIGMVVIVGPEFYDIRAMRNFVYLHPERRKPLEDVVVALGRKPWQGTPF